MANDIGVSSFGAVVPVARKDGINPGNGLKDKAAPDSLAASSSASAEKPPEKQLEKQDIEQSVQDLNSLVQELQRELRFSVDDNSGETVVKVVDRHTDEVVRQIPSEDILQLRERLEAATGALFSGKA